MTAVCDMPTEYAADRAEGYRLRSLTQREDGSVVGDMVVATVGTMEYPHGTDVVPRETLADEAAIESLRLRPIIGPETHTADQVVVTPAEIARRRIGHVGSQCRMEGDDLVCDFVIDTPEGKALLENGLRAVSPGYTVQRMRQEPGEPGDYLQAQRRYLHVALVERARGGDRVRIVDSATFPEDPMEPDMLKAMLKELLDEALDGYAMKTADLCGQKMADMMKPADVPAKVEAEEAVAADAAPVWSLAETRRVLALADDRRVDVTACGTVTDAARKVAATLSVAADASTDTLRGVIAAAPLSDGWQRRDVETQSPRIPLVGHWPTVKE